MPNDDSTQTVGNQQQTQNEPDLSTTLQSFEGGGSSTEGGGEPQQQTTQQQAEPKSLLTDADVARLGEAFRAAAPSQGQQTTQTQQRTYTQEEINKLLNVFEPDDELMGMLADPATMKAGMSKLVAGLRKEYNTLLQVQLATMKKEVDGTVAPVRETLAKKQAEDAEAAFYAEHKDLNFDKGKEATQVVLSTLVNKGAFQGKSPDEARKLLAGETRAFLTRMGVSASPSGAGTQQQSGTTNRRPASLSNGANSGAHGNGTSANPTEIAGQLRQLGL